MLDSLPGLIANAGALVVLALALLRIAVTLRRDTAEELTRRVGALETEYRYAVARIYQLETTMREAGMTVPPWPARTQEATP
ncbi:hypothetical protein [Occultella kanbiaonis]|uniref:hypothetical protein n=1 Tax=Occultella kanbiaonis TaxID=2675754 RepID=UPI0012B77CDE|nr:hypothetical protein [Occultella kanbiaonis]